MGSVVVNIMAGGSLAAEPKKLHPFFAAPKTIHQDTSTTTLDFVSASEEIDDPNPNPPEEPNGDSQPPEDHAPKRRKRKSADGEDEDLDEKKKPKRGKKAAAVQQSASIMSHFQKLHGEDIEPPIPEQLVAVPEENVESTAVETTVSTASTNDKMAASNGAQSNNPMKATESCGPPKKMLQFNPKTGTIGSPPKLKEATAPKALKKSKQAKDQDEDTLQDQNQSQQASRGKRRSERVITVKYGKDEASRKRIGTKIDDIINSPAVVPSSPPRRPRGRPRKSTKVPQDTQAVDDTKSNTEAPQNSTHPFFTGKAKPAATPSTTSTDAPATMEAVKPKPSPARTRPRIFSSTPCSPKKSRPTATAMPLPQFGVKSLGLKTPGARLPAWPPKDMVHVRGDGDTIISSHQPGQLLPARKSKGNTTNITQDESILYNTAKKLRIPEAVDAVKNIDTASFLPPPPELRLPQKHFESGVKLEKRIMRQVKNPQHPALAPLRDLVTGSLSAFDKYQCESLSWAQKYAPKSAVEVLQFGKEAFLLRDWLRALRIQSVDTGEAKVKATKPPKKKRRKNKSDGFIVDSDEEANEMDEVSDPEEDWSPDRRGVKKTVIRAGDVLAKGANGSARLTNTVVISGPHGCGKTATVYALAKELDFEVFEINPGSRRSGKDIMEKIGDMTRNHLVQHHQTEVPVATINDEEVEEDIKSGKQATMNAFFQPRAAAKAVKTKPVKQAVLAPVKPEASKSSPKSAPKNQKQSLILLDEVDILYDEDKQFWTTVIGLIAQSKRPFVITCNDENLVPLQALSLHGIFRLSAPPADLAVDRLLMIAACEGHALQRSAVEALYGARQEDMRACLMDLNYWCQVAVGDQRGGVDWFYPRWPKGCDIDADGNVVRVISQDTYVKGMGWFAHDVADATAAKGTEEELMQEAHAFWDLDVGDWHEALYVAQAEHMNTDGKDCDSNHLFTRDKSVRLQEYEDFTDAMSMADLTSSMAFAATPFDEPIDCSLPEITEKKRDDYILGRQLLDAPVQATFDPLAASLPIALRSLAREYLSASAPAPCAGRLKPVDEGMLVDHIIRDRTEPPEAASLTRDDFSVALDTLAASDKGNNSTTYLDLSILDGTMQIVAVDVAPYVRGIVSYEYDLREQRQKLSSLISKGGKKRMRNTRASHAALEGGSRSTTRRERWFKSDLNNVLVMRTAGKGWSDALKEVASSAEVEAPKLAPLDACLEDEGGNSSGLDVE